MKASKFTDAEKAFIVNQGEGGTPVAEICRKSGISQATYFNWTKKCAGLIPSEMKKVREVVQAIWINVMKSFRTAFAAMS